MNNYPTLQPTPASHDSNGVASTDPNRLAPEDAFYAHSPPRRQWERSGGEVTGPDALDVDGSLVPGGVMRRRREKDQRRSASRKRKGAWKKLLWVKQSCTSPILRYESKH